MSNHTKEIAQFVEKIASKNPHETEFLQAVEEVAETIIPFIADKPKYKDSNLLETMCEPERVFMFRVPWLNDKGEVQVNRGYRIQMNSAIGPYKGGLRFHPSVNLSILKFLAFEQTFKNSLTTLPMGGGKGGSDFNPKGKSDNEVMKFCQSFMTELSKYIGQFTDVPAGDIGVGGREIGYMFGQYKRVQGEFTGVLTGKGLQYGGSLIRPEATGYGCVYFSKEVLNHINDGLDGKSAIVSGSGNVAQFTVEKLIQNGAKVLSMSDSGGTVYDKDGITQEKLEFIKELKNVKRGRIKEYADKYKAEFHEGKTPWDIKCDIAYPCATQNELQVEDAKTLQKNGCIGVFEGANMPCTADAIEVFKEHKMMFTPGKASNAGGVATSGLEMSQNSLRLSWTRDEVDERLQGIMKEIHRNCVQHGKVTKDYVDYVKGANIAGFVKVADAMLAQGCV
ncbi:glutamate dehydrogenase (NADP+) [Ekhidna lutea]|uniref:Glutamate dehydrogenase n=1 Tax=Ekhidna lutea TaxID=447679 RepID=A0A239EW47_EKHLU|nr:NADP-specific glutamate dehydrogenase [Ekhidna lutea]SNS48044.1 glutamate dehydrogenase (NADP+) [Ekhidna lutea]